MIATLSDNLVYPDGYMKNACLPRVTLPGQLVCAPRFEENIEVIPQTEWYKYIDDLENRQYIKWMLDQKHAGSCAWEALTQGMMGTAKKAGLSPVLLNPYSGYAFTSGGVDRGSSIDTNLEFAMKKGCLPEAIWSRSKGILTKAPEELWQKYGKFFRIDEAYDCTSTAETGTALIRGFMVQMGYRGHSVLLLHMIDQYRALFANSWGKGWGDMGFGIINLSSVNYMYGAFAFRSVYDFTDYYALVA